MAGELITPDTVMDAVDLIMSVPLDWGRADCCSSACDVFLALHGIDPMAPVRGSYASAISAARVIRRWGGFVSMADQLARMSRLVVSDGVPGAIGISAPGMALGPERRALLICIQPGAWAGKTEDGYAVIGTAERCWTCAISC